MTTMTVNTNHYVLAKNARALAHFNKLGYTLCPKTVTITKEVSFNYFFTYTCDRVYVIGFKGSRRDFRKYLKYYGILHNNGVK